MRPLIVRLAVLLLAAAPSFADGQTKVSINVEDTSVRDIVTTLARAASVEVVLRPEARGTITVSLRDLPFEQALSVVTSTAGLRWRLVDGVYHVGRFSNVADQERRRERIVLRRLEARPLARSFGWIDLESLDEDSPGLDLRALLPPGLSGPPRPVTGEGLLGAAQQALEVEGTAAAIADLRHLVGGMDAGPGRITYQLFVAGVAPATLEELPIAWARGPMQFGASPGRRVRSSTGDYGVLLGRLQAGMAGVTPLAVAAEQLTELASYRLLIAGDGPTPLTLSAVVRAEQALSLRLWLRMSVPADGQTVELTVDGALMPPEEGCILVSEPDGDGPPPVLVVLLPKVQAAED